MLQFLRNIEIDRLSFWLGFAAGGLFWVIASRLRNLFPRWKAKLQEGMQTARKGLMANTGARLRSETLRYAQHLHLASPLFSLDEILIQPSVLAPPVRTNPDAEETGDPTPDGLIYLPDWPELPACYHAPVLSLTEAMEGGANLVLIGHPGSGKTVALAHLASVLARESAEAGILAEYLPLFIHASSLSIFTDIEKEPLEILTGAVADRSSALLLPRLPALIKSSIDQGRALLLLDGLDEMPHPKVDLVVDFIERLLDNYPGIRIIASASLEYQGRLSSLGFFPVAISAWDLRQRKEFIHRWGELWTRLIPNTSDLPDDLLDPLILNGWLLNPEAPLTPLELTLKLWASYAGDALGSRPSDHIEAYLLRMSANIPMAGQILEKLSAQMTLQAASTASPKDIDVWLKEVKHSVDAPAETIALPEDSPSNENQPEPGAQLEEVEDTAPKKSEKSNQPPQTKGALGSIPALVSAGLLLSHKDSSLRFSHPVLQAYLAAKSIAASENIDLLVDSPNWTGKALALRYLASICDLGSMAAGMLKQKEDPLLRELMVLGRWLREASPASSWRSGVLRRLAGILQQEYTPLSIRIRALAALACSGDTSVQVLFRQMLENPQPSARYLGVLGCGLLSDTKAINHLITLFDDPESQVRCAAVQTLAAIGTKPALDAVASALLQGTEDIRRVAAEALAALPEEGHPALKDGATMDDLLVRRAVVYGLAKINEPWARKILETMQIEDSQWVVRTAAIQAVEDLEKTDFHIPRPIPPLNETPWLILFAGTLGMGVTPGKPAVDLLLQALKNGSEAQRMAALDYLMLKGDEGSIPAIYNTFYGSNECLRESAYLALWQMAASGIELPSPTQFGLG